MKLIENFLKHKKVYGLFILIITLNILLVTYIFMKKDNKFETLSNSVLMLKVYDVYDKEVATGSGFLIFNNDILVTNYHVIKEAARIDAVDEKDVTYSISNVIATDENKDLALLRFSAKTNLKPLNLSDSSKISKGDEVIAIGSPLGLKNTVSSGIVSSLREDETGNFIQITAPISNGSSGGALFSKSGKIIGVTFAGVENGENLNLAIPSNYIKELYNNRSDEKAVRDFLFEHNPLEKYKTECEHISINDIYMHSGKYHEKDVCIEGWISSLGYSGGREKGRGYIVTTQYDISNSIEYDNNRTDCEIIHFFNIDDNFNTIYENKINVGDHITLYGKLFDSYVFKEVYGREIGRPKIIKVN